MKFTRLKDIKDRRNYYRYETDLTVAFRKEEATHFVPAKIINISVVGAYLKSKKPLRSGKQIELNFQLPGSSKKIITCLAKVSWSAKFKGYHSGIRFINLNRFDQYRIAGFIRDGLRKKGFRKS